MDGVKVVPRGDHPNHMPMNSAHFGEQINGFCQTEEGRGQSIDRSRWMGNNKAGYKESLTEIEDIMKRIKFVEGNNFKRDPAYFKDRPKVETTKGRGNHSSNQNEIESMGGGVQISIGST